MCKVDVNLPVELYNPKTGETREVTSIVVSHTGTSFTVAPSVTSNGYVNYNFDGTAYINYNPWTIRNKKMLDLNKSLIVGDKDAKVIHTFDNGNVAVVVDGKTDVYTFTSNGEPRGTTNYKYMLKNKVVETVRYLNVYPTEEKVFIHRTLPLAETAAGRMSHEAFKVKQTLIDGKVVKNEIV